MDDDRRLYLFIHYVRFWAYSSPRQEQDVVVMSPLETFRHLQGNSVKADIEFCFNLSNNILTVPRAAASLCACVLVEGQPVYAHKVLCMRCTYFRAMLTGEMKESRAKTVTLPDVRRPIFLALLEYLYTDEVISILHSLLSVHLLPRTFTGATAPEWKGHNRYRENEWLAWLLPPTVVGKEISIVMFQLIHLV